jgi:hypothetical protein
MSAKALDERDDLIGTAMWSIGQVIHRHPGRLGWNARIPPGPYPRRALSSVQARRLTAVTIDDSRRPALRTEVIG